MRERAAVDERDILARRNERFGDFGSAVSDCDDTGAGVGIQVATAVGGLQIGAVAAHDRDRTMMKVAIKDRRMRLRHHAASRTKWPGETLRHCRAGTL